MFCTAARYAPRSLVLPSKRRRWSAPRGRTPAPAGRCPPERWREVGHPPQRHRDQGLAGVMAARMWQTSRAVGWPRRWRLWELDGGSHALVVVVHHGRRTPGAAPEPSSPSCISVRCLAAAGAVEPGTEQLDGLSGPHTGRSSSAPPPEVASEEAGEGSPGAEYGGGQGAAEARSRWRGSRD